MASDIELNFVDKDPPWLSAVVVQPGDVLVIVLPEGTTRQTFDGIVAEASTNRPDLKDRLLFIAGVTGLAVLKAERETPTSIFDEVCDRCGQPTHKPTIQGLPAAHGMGFCVPTRREAT